MNADDSSCLPEHNQRQNKCQRGFLHFNACLPAVVMAVCLYALNNIVMAIFVFQILCMISLPLIYIHCMMVEGGKIYEVLMRRLLRDWRAQVPWALLGFVGCCGGGFVFFLLIQAFQVVDRKEVVSTAESDGLNRAEFPMDWMVVGIALEFTLVNSLLEEVFWRVYLYRELGGVRGFGGTGDSADDLLSSAGSSDGGVSESTGLNSGINKYMDCTSLLDNGSSNSSASSLENGFGGAKGGPGGLNGTASVMCGGGSLCGLPHQETPKVLINCYYASYHVVVMLCFVPWFLAAGGFGGLVVLGRLLLFCRERDSLGFLTAWGIHAGLDGAFCLIMLQLYTHFVHK
mmetsp:Transcript_75370/g.151547  ORF Transcript_75370/g.151547 Transcript_75370/m.151547 type:complete len:344 (+) Transcript_75370:71-1102(+)